MNGSTLGTVKVISLYKVLLYLVVIAGFFGSSFFSIDLGGFHIFLFRFLLLLLWFAAILYVFLNHGKLNISHIRVKYYLQFLALWGLYAVLTLAWVNSPAEAVRHVILLVSGISMSFFVVGYFTRLEDFRRLYFIWLLVLLPMIGLGFWNHLTGQHLAGSALAYAPERFIRMPTAVFHNPNDYATYLALSVPFMLVLIRYAQSKITALWGLVMLLATLYLLVVTLSRANYLAVILGVSFWFLFLHRLSKKLRVAVLSVLLALSLFAVFPNQFADVTNNIGVQMASLAVGSELQEGSVGVRINLLKNALIFTLEHYGFGVGAGNIEYHMANYPFYDTGGIINVHNWWVEILANYGFFIFAGYLLFYWGIVISLYQAHSKQAERAAKMVCEALLVALVIFFLASISSSTIMGFTPMWTLFAFALGFLNYHRMKQVRGADQ